MNPEMFDILLVDDRPASLGYMEDILDEPHYRLLKARSGLEALEQVLQHDFALILLDVNMPGLNGFDTARLIKGREECRHVPIIFLTASDEAPRFVSEGYSTGAVDYLCKVVDPLVLKAKVAAFIELSRKNKAVEASARRLRDSRRYEDCLRTQSVSRILLDSSLRIRAGNQRFYRTFGVSPAAAEGCPLASLPGGFGRLPALEERLRGVLLQGLFFSGLELPADVPGHGPRVFSLSARRVVREENESSVALLELEDMTERRRARELEDIRRRESLHQDFMASISHEFRTPVAAIKGFVETLARGGLDDRKNRLKFLDLIDKNAERLGRLVEDLLDLAELQAEERKPVPEDLSLPCFLERFARNIAPLAEGKRVSLRTRAEGPLRAWADPRGLERALQSLCENAINSSGAGDVVEISAAVAEANALVSIRDRGKGISKELLNRLFEPFSRERRPGPRARLGLGLGLLIAKSSVESNGGRLWAENNPDGPGATFRFTLPLKRPC